MDEITFEDILTHYEGKLMETSDGIENIRGLIKKCQEVSENAWVGLAASAFRLKLEEIDSEVLKAQGELSDALTKLTAIGNLLVEGE